MKLAPGLESPLDRARRKTYRRLLPLLFVCYVIAYIDRANVSIAKLTMTRDLPGFWHGSYKEVAKDMRGRYPKHFWPDNPANAVATTKTKRNM